jgi:YegS/Rv2252/BmrU family lipid kinase
MVFHFVVNPAGASGRTGKQFAALKPLLDASGADIRVHQSTPERDIEAVCKEVLRETQGEEINLVIVGGDGTFNRAVNAVEDFSRVRLGLVPAGSGNDLARALGLAQRPEEVLRVILQGKVQRTLDFGEVVYHNLSDIQPVGRGRKAGDVRRFAVSCGFGYDAAICQGVEISRFKPVLNHLHLGKLIYICVAIRLIFTTKLAELRLDIDGRQQAYHRGLFAVCMNTAYEGGGFRFCPEADGDDGVMDVCISNPLHSKMVFFRAFPMAYKGAHVKLRDVFWMERGRQIRMQADRPLWVHTDGEVEGKSSDITVRVGAQKIRLLM